jgi:hypothetical protein
VKSAYNDSTYHDYNDSAYHDENESGQTHWDSICNWAYMREILYGNVYLLN